MRPRILLAAAAVLFATSTARADHDSIDEAFAQAAPAILKQLKEQKAANVGVLKFLVSRGGEKPSDAVGELNMNLADRFEAALILANGTTKLPILDRASAAVVANNNRWANHLTAEGRKAFFADTYPLAWGNRDKKVKPDTFLTGHAAIAKDLKTIKITLQAFGADGEMKDIGKAMDVATTRRSLVDAGYSYILLEKAVPHIFDGARGAPNKGVRMKAKQDDEVTSLQQALVLNDPVKTDGVRFTAEDALRDCPVKLTILYNDKPVRVEGDRVAEPKEGDKVSFRIENTDKSHTFAVVLKINGKNILYMEDAEPARCLKWILGPGKAIDVKGFQEDEKTATPFRILSDKEAKEGIVRYGDLVGTMRMVVFRGVQTTEDPSLIEKEEPNNRQVLLAAISRGAGGLNKTGIRPGSLQALREDLMGREAEPEGARGIIDKGAAKVDSPIQRVYFKTLPTVGVADITIRYYSPK